MATEGTLVFMRSFGCKQNLLFRPDSSANVTQGCAEKLQERLLRNTWGHRHHYTRATCTMDWLELEFKRCHMRCNGGRADRIGSGKVGQERQKKIHRRSGKGIVICPNVCI
ncbi:uncharacterized protein LOC118409100 isoform X5 [Branchiostoma floridae]|uniref:Uncharacterized protein LOC118409100 isoform X5 n=1 Tax=Branchiostoma floridae TaxID=7739 RepID=A0A9J7HV93_BRAFL|nr:uncharacterized protein LOC118409100 isoform X5 [Branchiostoma floridae]